MPRTAEDARRHASTTNIGDMCQLRLAPRRSSRIGTAASATKIARMCRFLCVALLILSLSVSRVSGRAGGDGHGHADEHGGGGDNEGHGHGGGDHSEGEAGSSVIPKAILAHKWSYHNKKTGPPRWERLFKACGGQFQSPIDIDSKAAVYWGNAPFEFVGYDQLPASMYIQNNGHTAMLVPEQPILPRVKGGDLGGEYELVQVHFHWGSRSSRGSEHFIDSKAYPLEMHMVHYNSRFPGIREALATHDHDALAVLGFLFHVSDEDNGRLDSLIARINRLPESNGTVVFPRKSMFPMSDLIDVDVGKHGVDEEFNEEFSDFFRYEGSLTTPTCNEQVTWTVFPRTIPISERQLNVFRRLTDKLGYTINDNYRPVFPLGGRLLRRYSPKEPEVAAGGASGGDGGGEEGQAVKPRPPSSHLNTVDADFVKHDHDKDHDIFFDPAYYARPDIKEILDEEDKPAPAPKNTDSVTALREKLAECEELRRTLAEAVGSGGGPRAVASLGVVVAAAVLPMLSVFTE